MTKNASGDSIRILIADDSDATEHMKALDALDAELFDEASDAEDTPHFEIVSCSQGQDAVDAAMEAANDGQPFDVVILDVRMPPGIDGVEAGRQIRNLDPDVEIVFVTGFSDVPREELERRVPPPMKLHYFNKPLSFMRLAQDVAGMVGAH